MGYKKAEEVLPTEIIELIQQYVDGQSIYIPRKARCRKEWGTSTNAKQQVLGRNQDIYRDFCTGMTVQELVVRYYLSEKSIQRIIREMRQNRKE